MSNKSFLVTLPIASLRPSCFDTSDFFTFTENKKIYNNLLSAYLKKQSIKLL